MAGRLSCPEIPKRAQTKRGDNCLYAWARKSVICDSTTIGYDLPVAAEVTLEVYNLLGQVVTTLVDERQDAGHHEVIWNGMNNAGKPVSSGVYLYRISTDGFTQTRKMTLIK